MRAGDRLWPLSGGWTLLALGLVGGAWAWACWGWWQAFGG